MSKMGENTWRASVEACRVRFAPKLGKKLPPRREAAALWIIVRPGQRPT